MDWFLYDNDLRHERVNLFSWCENFVKTDSFRRVSCDSPEALLETAFSKKNSKLGNNIKLRYFRQCLRKNCRSREFFNFLLWTAHVQRNDMFI